MYYNSSGHNSKRIAKNTIALYIRSFISMLLGLYSSRLLLQILGVEDFGIYNAVGGMVLLFSFLCSSLSVSSQRYLNYEMGKGNPMGVNQVFCMSVNVLFLLALLMTILSEIIGLYLLYNYLSIPVERIDTAFIVLQCSIISLFITIVSVPYNAMIIAMEDMRSFAYIDILGAFLKLLSICGLWIIPFDHLITYSVFIVVIQIILRMIYAYVCRKKYVESKYSWYWDRKLFKGMVSFGSWTTLSAISMVGRQQGLVVLYNAFYGVAINAAIGIANQVNTALNTLVNNFTTSFNPQITKSYAANEWAYCQKLHFSGPKIAFFLISIASVPFFLFGDYILNLWLKNVPSYSLLFVHLILIETLLKSLSATSNTIVRATGKVKSYELILNSITFLFMILSYVCFKYRFGLVVPYLCLIISTFVGHLFATYRSCEVIHIKWTIYVYQVTCKMLIPYGISLLILYNFTSKCTTLGFFLAESLICMSLVAISEYLWGFDSVERSFIKGNVNRFKNKLLRK